MKVKASVYITKKIVGESFLVHNGMKFIRLLVLDIMVGFKFGSFIVTKL